MNNDPVFLNKRIKLEEALNLYCQSLDLPPEFLEETVAKLKGQGENIIYLSDHPLHIYHSSADYYLDAEAFNMVLEMARSGKRPI